MLRRPVRFDPPLSTRERSLLVFGAAALLGAVGLCARQAQTIRFDDKVIDLLHQQSAAAEAQQQADEIRNGTALFGVDGFGHVVLTGADGNVISTLDCRIPSPAELRGEQP